MEQKQPGGMLSTMMTLEGGHGGVGMGVKIKTHQAQVVVIEGPHQGLVVPIERELLEIGRADWCDIALPDDLQVSKQHCELSLDAESDTSADAVRVRDLGSRNGVMVGPTRLLEGYWEPGQTLRVGSSVLRLQGSGEPREIELRFVDQSGQLVGRSPAMRRLFSMIERLGAKDISVLLLGETGVGKTAVARALHAQSRRADGPFVEVNCGALSAQLVESLLFGHEKGAFTGAERSHRGYFEQAHGGTLFLDEIGELPLALQPKLLSVLERGKVQRLGGEREVDVDVRVIASTNRQLGQEIAAGRFRRDLFFRLAVVELSLPPLRERLEDLPLLVAHLARQWGEESLLLTEDALGKLQQHLWPGNVRELSNVLGRAVALRDPVDGQLDDLYLNADDIVLSETLLAMPVEVGRGEGRPVALPVAPSGQLLPGFETLKELMETTERDAIVEALEDASWNVPAAAERLGITRVWLYRRMKKYEIQQPSK